MIMLWMRDFSKNIHKPRFKFQNEATVGWGVNKHGELRKEELTEAG